MGIYMSVWIQVQNTVHVRVNASNQVPSAVPSALAIRVASLSLLVPVLLLVLVGLPLPPLELLALMALVLLVLLVLVAWSAAFAGAHAPGFPTHLAPVSLSCFI
jgi:hypothetical protein